MNTRLALAMLALGHSVRKGPGLSPAGDVFFQPRRDRPFLEDAPPTEVARNISALAAQWLRSAKKLGD